MNYNEFCNHLKTKYNITTTLDEEDFTILKEVMPIQKIIDIAALRYPFNHVNFPHASLSDWHMSPIFRLIADNDQVTHLDLSAEYSCSATRLPVVALQQNTNLRGLDMTNWSYINDYSLQAIARSTTLTYANLSRVRLHNGNALLRNQTLTYLSVDLSGNQDIWGAIDSLSNNTTLQTLSISGEPAAALQILQRNTTLQELTVNSNYTDNAFHAATDSSTQKLTITSADLYTYSNYLKPHVIASNITSFDMFGLSDNIPMLEQLFHTFSSLRQLKLSNPTMMDDALQVVLKSDIETLDISGTNLTRSSLLALNASRLKSLCANWIHLVDDSSDTLKADSIAACFKNNTSLTSLELSLVGMTPRGASVLINSANLAHVRVNASSWPNHPQETEAMLKKCKSRKLTLDIDSQDIDLSFVRHLDRNPNVKDLSVIDSIPDGTFDNRTHFFTGNKHLTNLKCKGVDVTIDERLYKNSLMSILDLLIVFIPFLHIHDLSLKMIFSTYFMEDLCTKRMTDCFTLFRQSVDRVYNKRAVANTARP